MKSSICQSRVIKLKELNNLFIEMSAKTCNQHCKHCFIDFPKYNKKCDDFISIDIIKSALKDTLNENIKCIYLSGAEPMMHPDFNAILRLCLKRANVCICTNGSFINEKKARFLKKVENESDYEIFFQISLDHYNEIKNDDIRARGAFRQAVFAVKYLSKYDFEPIVVCTNYYNEPENIIFDEFCKIFTKVGYNLDKSHLNIIPWHDNKSSNQTDNNEHDWEEPDCDSCRVLTSKGIYSCPFLSNDYRGRCGSSFKDYSDKCSLEADFCETCAKHKGKMFSLNFSNIN